MDTSLSICHQFNVGFLHRKFVKDFIDFEKGIHVKSITLILHGNFNVDSTFKIDKVLMKFPCGFFCVIVMSNRRNCFTHGFLSIIFEHFIHWEPIVSESGIVLSRSFFNNIDVIVDIGTIRTITFSEFFNNANNYKYIIFIFFKITITKIIMSIFINKNDIYLLQNNTKQQILGFQNRRLTLSWINSL